jgi:predicted ATP-grasp superfamily ATP-dependent carboligase|tara:strand:- start:1324 stop:2322 length:999 start_codon:yes stop_codon:yes gene_type:complete
MANVLLTGAAGAIGMDLAFSLNQAKVNTYATEADDDNFSLVNKNCKYYKKVFKVPRAGSDNYIHTINKIISDESIDLVIPNPDFEVGFISKIRDQINSPLFLPSDETVQILLSKSETAKKIGAFAPKTFDVDSEDDLSKAISSEEVVWLRPKTGAGGKGSLVVSDSKFGWMWIKYWRERGFSSTWIAQEYLRGGNYNVTLIFNRNSKLCGMGMLERLGYIHEAISPTGITGDVRLAKTVKLHKIVDVAKKAVNMIDSNPVGIFSVDLMGEKVSEINPRFAGRPRLYTLSGANFPAHIVDMELNGNSSYLESNDGYKLIRQVDIEPVAIKLEE